MSNKIGVIVFAYGKVDISIVNDKGNIFAVYQDDWKFICKAKDWHLFEPVLGDLMSFAYDFAGAV